MSTRQEQIIEILTKHLQSGYLDFPKRLNIETLANEIVTALESSNEPGQLSAEEYIDKLYSVSFEYEDSDGIKHSPWLTRDDAIKIFNQFASLRQHQEEKLYEKVYIKSSEWGKLTEEQFHRVWTEAVGMGGYSKELFQKLIESMKKKGFIVQSHSDQPIVTDEEIEREFPTTDEALMKHENIEYLSFDAKNLIGWLRKFNQNKQQGAKWMRSRLQK